MVIFNIYQNLFDNYNSFALPQKSSNFLWYFDGNSPVIICSEYIFKTKIRCICFCGELSAVKIANWSSFLNASFSGGLKIFYGRFFVSSLR